MPSEQKREEPSESKEVVETGGEEYFIAVAPGEGLVGRVYSDQLSAATGKRMFPGSKVKRVRVIDD